MDGQYEEGWFIHPQLDLIKISLNDNQTWVYQCFTSNGASSVSREKDLDQWTWVLCEPKEE